MLPEIRKGNIHVCVTLPDGREFALNYPFYGCETIPLETLQHRLTYLSSKIVEAVKGAYLD